jgi:hypothetical protein
LSEKIKAVRTAATRFSELAQLCSYEAIARTHLDVREQTRMSANAYEQLFQRFDDARLQSRQQTQILGAFGNAFLNEQQATTQTIRIMGTRIMELEVIVSRFAKQNRPRLPLKQNGERFHLNYYEASAEFAELQPQASSSRKSQQRLETASMYS